MSRPVHFADAHTAERQARLRFLHAESNRDERRGMQMITGLIGILLAIALGVIFADWITGLEVSTLLTMLARS